MPPPFRLSVAAAILGISGALLTISGAARQAGGQFGIAVDLNQLDVSVLDKQRRPVRGLSQADFTVLEDGKPQKIQVFLPVDLSDQSGVASNWIGDQPFDVVSNTGVEEQRLVVIVMDDFAIDVQYDLAGIKSAKEIGRGIIDQLGPQDLAAVVFTMASKNSQEFTHDKDRLRAAVDRFSPGASHGQPELVMRHLEYISETLGSVPNRRKAMVWVTSGFVPPLTEWTLFLDAARRANVNVYPIDPMGLRVPDVTGPQATNAGAPVGGLATAVMPDPAGIQAFKESLARGNESSRLKALRETLSATAANTGGRAFTAWNEFRSSVKQVFTETGSFYLLGYSSSNTVADGRFRRLQVKVNKPGVTVNTRAGYYGPRAETTIRRPMPSSQALDALSGLVPARGLRMHLTAAPFAAIDGPAVAIALTVAMPSTGAEDLDVVVSAFTFDGVLKRSIKFIAPAKNGETPIFTRLDLTPGRYQVRAGVSGMKSQARGSVYADVDVPDFLVEPLSMSGVVLSRSSDSGGRSGLESLTPLTPTTQRSFLASDPVSFLINVYQPARLATASVALKLILRGRDGRVVVERQEALQTSDLTASVRTAGYRGRLPMEGLTAGEYLLTVEVTAERAQARRNVRFSIQGR